LEEKSAKTSMGSFLSGMGTVLRLPSGARLAFLHPDPGDSGISDSNDRSIVAELTYSDHSFLFMGDLSKKSEKRIRTSGTVDVLKVGHHGSKTSTGDEFLGSIRPRDAVISVGKNSYGHPSARVMESLGRIGANVLRTDKAGSILYTCLPGKEECAVEFFRR
jgi:beta-lactamase superfamily II metal-dependent hydrolase